MFKDVSQKNSQKLLLDFQFLIININIKQKMMDKISVKRTFSNKTENSTERIQQPIIILPVAKIHRANILARIINSISIYKAEWAFNKIKCQASIRRNRYKKMGLAINRIFRRHFHQDKFNGLQKIKKQLIHAQQHQIKQSQIIVQSMSKASKSIILIVLKSKRKQILSQCFQRIKLYAIQLNFQKRTEKRKGLRKIMQILMKNKRYAFDKIYSSRVNTQRRQKLKILIFAIQNQRRKILGWSLWKLRKNLTDKRREQVQNDIKMFESKINNSNDPELQAIKQKKDKLEQHLNRVQQQKNALQQQFMSQYNEIQGRRKQLQDELANLQQKKQSLQTQIVVTQQKVNAPYSIDEIYQCVYHNFLLYLYENKQKVYNKQEVLSALTFPLIPIDVATDTIKQQNQVMKQLLNQYIVMFGPKKLETPIHLPYEYLVKENQTMYKMLLTLLPEIESDRDDLRIIRDSLFKLSAKVNQLWGK